MLQLSITQMNGLQIVLSLLSKNLFSQRLKKPMLEQKVHFRPLLTRCTSSGSGLDSLTLFVGAAEITMVENNIIVYKFVQDLHFFVTGGDEENELILATVLQGFFDAVTLLLRFISQHV